MPLKVRLPGSNEKIQRSFMVQRSLPYLLCEIIRDLAERAETYVNRGQLDEAKEACQQIYHLSSPMFFLDHATGERLRKEIFGKKGGAT